MEIITFTTYQSGNWQPMRVGACLSGDYDGYLLDFERAFDGKETPSNHLAWYDMDRQWFQQSRERYETLLSEPGLRTPAVENRWLTRRSGAYWLAPVPRPGKLICIGLNYRDHAAESGAAIPDRPVVFSKFTSAIIAPGEAVTLPAGSSQVDYEAELAVVIGRRAKNVSVTHALEYVLGYTAFNDVSARDFQFADGQWQRGKSCDTFAPMGRAIVTADSIPDPNNLSIELRLNGKIMQQSNTGQMIFNVAELIAFISQTIALEPGDVIATGTPSGVGFARQPPVFLQPGDLMEIEIEGIGVLDTPVAATDAGIFPVDPLPLMMRGRS